MQPVIDDQGRSAWRPDCHTRVARDIAVARRFGGGSHARFEPFLLAQSHDGGATSTQTELVESNRYSFDFDSDVVADGTVHFAETSLLDGAAATRARRARRSNRAAMATSAPGSTASP